MRSGSVRIKKIVQRGAWLYDNSIPCELLIVRQNYFEGPQSDEEPTPGYPPTDAEGCHYYAAYVMNGATRSVTNCFGSAAEAAQKAAETLGQAIKWQS